MEGYDAPGAAGPGSYIFQRGRWWKSAPGSAAKAPVQMATMADVAALQAALDALVAVAPKIPADVVQALQDRTTAAEQQAAVVAGQVVALQQVAASVAPAVQQSTAERATLREQVTANTTQVATNSQAVARLGAEVQALRTDLEALRTTVTANLDAMRVTIAALAAKVDTLPPGITNPAPVTSPGKSGK